MRYLFFDIDGTLLLTGGAGRIAMTQVMTEMYGIRDLHPLEVHGRTDRAIISDLFRSHQVDLTDTVHQEFSRRYHELLPDCLNQCEGRLMPGVEQLMNQLSSFNEVRLGILTGNSKWAAEIKLKHFQLDQYFEFGGFGHEHVERNDIAREALAACRARYAEDKIQPDQIWVIGDTIHDIRCARSIRARAVAVATGGTDRDRLARHGPDVLLDSFIPPDRFLSSLI